jgi:hypothetical protein
MFQQKDAKALAEEVIVDWEKVVVADAATLKQLRLDPRKTFHINTARFLVALGLCESRTQGERQADVGVMIDSVKRVAKLVEVPGRPARITVQVGKRAKVAVVQ